MKSEHTENDVDLRSVVYVCVSDNDVQDEKQYPELGKHEDVFDRTVSRIFSQHKYYRSEKGRGHVVCQRHILCTHGCTHVKMIIPSTKKIQALGESKSKLFLRNENKEHQKERKMTTQLKQVK